MSTISVTNVKHESSTSNNIVLDSSANATLGANATVTGNLTVSGTGNQSIAGTLQFNSGYGSVATAYGVRAWINFNGTAATIGTGRASANMDAVTDNGTGDYTLNFTNAMPDTDFALVGTAGNTGTNFGAYLVDFSPTHNRTTSSVRIWTGSSSALQDTAIVNVAIFR